MWSRRALSLVDLRDFLGVDDVDFEWDRGGNREERRFDIFWVEV